MDLFSILPNCQIKLKKWVKTLQTMEKILLSLVYIFKVRKGIIYGKNYEYVDAQNWGIEGRLVWRKKMYCAKKKNKSIFWKMLTSMMCLTLSTIHTCKFFCLQCLRVALVLFYLLFSMLIFTAYYSQIFFS